LSGSKQEKAGSVKIEYFFIFEEKKHFRKMTQIEKAFRK
jgi:hypothetical protein